MLFNLIYTSRSNGTMTIDQIDQIVAVARDRNQELKITGILLYKDNTFMQLLEGNPTNVKELFYGSIAKDERHKKVKVVTEDEVAERSFKNWFMAFEDLGNLEARDAKKFSPFLQDGFTMELFSHEPREATNLLQKFRTMPKYS